MLLPTFFSLMSAVLLVSGEALFDNRMESNAQRMARGLGPNHPTRLFGSTRGIHPRTAPGAMASPTGRILVYKDTLDGQFLGYLDAYNNGAVNPDLSSLVSTLPQGRTTYSYTAQGNYNTTTLEILLPELTPTYRLALWSVSLTRGASAAQIATQVTLGPGFKTYVIGGALTQSDNTTPPPYYNPGPSHSGDMYGVANVFTVVPSTGEIKAQWTNPDGTKPATFPIFRGRSDGQPGGSLSYTGDVAAYLATSPQLSRAALKFDVQ
ncbi:hypothetical protein C8R43DRAFT_1101242 [Mycena crocata]|nr:hypothetical protein C8R43DRAFT_1101242 [Mycena crocata]